MAIAEYKIFAVYVNKIYMNDQYTLKGEPLAWACLGTAEAGSCPHSLFPGYTAGVG